MSEENKDLQEMISETFEEGTYPVIEFDENDTNDEIEILSGDELEKLSENMEDEVLPIDFTLEEKRKLLRKMRKVILTDQEIEDLTEDELKEIREYAKMLEFKAIYKYVTRKKSVTDEEIKNLSDLDRKDLMQKFFVVSKFFTYNPKKKFGVAYKKERQRKNKQAKASRKANR
jgi:hypothetical protein